VPKLSAKDLSDCGILAFNRHGKDRLRTKVELIPALAGLEDSPWGEWTGLRHGRPAHAGARRYRPLVTPLGHQIEAALAAGTMPGNEIRERIFPSAIRGGIGLLLRTKRHTATGKQIQVLVAAVNRHMPATPSRCCRRRRGRTRSTFPGGNPGPRAMIPHLPPRPPTSSGSTWRGHGRASTAAMTHLVSSSKSKTRAAGPWSRHNAAERLRRISPTAAGSIARDHVAHSDIAAL
jgi:hypothetical protein